MSNSTIPETTFKNMIFESKINSKGTSNNSSTSVLLIFTVNFSFTNATTGKIL